jgi:hypothetical protein
VDHFNKSERNHPLEKYLDKEFKDQMKKDIHFMKGDDDNENDEDQGRKSMIFKNIDKADKNNPEAEINSGVDILI